MADAAGRQASMPNQRRQGENRKDISPHGGGYEKHRREPCPGTALAEGAHTGSGKAVRFPVDRPYQDVDRT